MDKKLDKAVQELVNCQAKISQSNDKVEIRITSLEKKITSLESNMILSEESNREMKQKLQEILQILLK